MPGFRRCIPLPVLISAALAPGCTSSGPARYDLHPFGEVIAAIAGAPRAFGEFIRSGAYDVVGPGADFEEWRLRYGN